jgi:transcription termination factor NusB
MRTREYADRREARAVSKTALFKAEKAKRVNLDNVISITTRQIHELELETARFVTEWAKQFPDEVDHNVAVVCERLLDLTDALKSIRMKAVSLRARVYDANAEALHDGR